MPTDKQKFHALMTEFGLVPEEETYADGSTSMRFETPQPKVVGYSSSFADFVFNPDGSFKEVGVWE